MPIGTYTPHPTLQNHYTNFFILLFHFRCILLQISHKKCFFISISILGRSGVKKGALDSDFMFVNIEPYKSKKCVPY